MENASLALRMAGGVLIALLIIGVFVSVMVVINNNQQKQQDEEDLRQVEQFNESYKSYENRIVTGYQMISLTNKAIDYNERMSKESKYADSATYYTPIHIYVILESEANGGSVKLPGQKTKNDNKNANKNNYIDLNDYYKKYYSSASTETKNEFKNMYFKWEKTEHVSPNAKDTEGKSLGNVDGVGRVYEMYFKEYVKD